MYCEVMHRVKKKFRYCGDSYILWIDRVYAFAIVEIRSIFRMVHKISLHGCKAIGCILIYLTHCRVVRVLRLAPNHQQCQREYWKSDDSHAVTAYILSLTESCRRDDARVVDARIFSHLYSHLRISSRREWR